MQIGISGLVKFAARTMIKNIFFKCPCKTVLGCLEKRPRPLHRKKKKGSYGKRCPQGQKNNVSRPNIHTYIDKNTDQQIGSQTV